MKTLLRCTLASLALAGAAQADSTAFIVGNSDNSAVERLRGGGAAVPAAEDLRRAGIEVVAIEDADKGQLRRSFLRFVAALDENDERVAVILTGRFVQSATDTFLLPTEFDTPLTYGRIATEALPLSSLLALLADYPGQALLLIGTEESDAIDIPFLGAGVGGFAVPQGVTVMRGTPRQVAALAKRDLPMPDQALVAQARASGMQVSGYAPADWVFLPEAPAQAEATPAPAGATGSNLAEERLWQSVTARDELEGYRNYLETFPFGAHANAARQRIRAIGDDPLRDARRAEEALNLSRDARRDIQRDLSLLEFDTRGIDGIFGPGTRAAVTSWQARNGFAETGFLTRDMIARLDRQASRRAAELEEQARQRQAELERQDRAYWGDTGANGDAAGLRAYLGRYPDGVYAELAQERLDAITADQRARAAARDRQAWDRARDAGTVVALQNYLSDFPNGAFVDQAQARIAELQRPAQDNPQLARAQAQEAALNLNVGARRIAEDRLKALGLKPGKVDGNFDKNTRRAIRRYQDARSLTVTGYLDQNTVVRLLADSLLR